MIEIDDAIIVIEKGDLDHLLVEGKSLFGVDLSTTAPIQKVFATLFGFGGTLKGKVAHFFRKVRREDTKHAQAEIEKEANAAEREMLTGLERLRQGSSPQAFKATMRKTLRSLHQNAFDLGLHSGGERSLGVTMRPLIPDEHKRWILDEIEKEQGHLDKLVGDIIKTTRVHRRLAKGRPQPPPRKDPTVRQYARRLRAYTDAAKSVFYAGRVFGAPDDMIIDWISPLDRNTCKSCWFLAQHSPYTRLSLPTLPRAGATRCRANCRCRIVLRAVGPLEKLTIEKRQPSKEWLRRRLEAIFEGKLLECGGHGFHAFTFT